MAHELNSTEILQTDFVSNVSHEFKTPINAIEGYSTLLQGSETLSQSDREYVDKILLNTQRLSSLVGSILLLSKLENQQIPTNQTEYRLDEQIRQSVVALESAWVHKDIELDVELDRVSYVGNEPMMRHVWDNLISNAIKFSPNGGAIKIHLAKKPKNIIGLYFGATGVQYKSYITGAILGMLPQTVTFCLMGMSINDVSQFRYFSVSQWQLRGFAGISC